MANRIAQESAEKFRGLFETSRDAIVTVEPPTWKFSSANPAAVKLFGAKNEEEVLSRGLWELSPERQPDERISSEKSSEMIEMTLRNGSHFFEWTHRRIGGEEFPADVLLTRMDRRGKVMIQATVRDITERKTAQDQIARYIARLETAFQSTLTVAMTLSEMRDPYTVGHERRVAEIAVAIGGELGFDANQREGLRVAGYLHDIGKISIPAEILAKPSRLSAAEFELVKGHAQASYDVLKGVDFPWSVAEVAWQHHERLDGTGYPQGLKGEGILLEARIMSVADVVEAMASHRPYRPGLGIDRALAEIERGRGTAYDRVVADACLKLFKVKGYTIPA